MTQHILTVRGDQLPEGWGPSGVGGCFTAHESQMFLGLMQAGLWIGPRPHLECDPTFRQLLPYVVLVDRLPGGSDTRFLSYHRTVKGGEARLHGNTSIGFGGHVDVGDLVLEKDESINLRFTLEAAAEREMLEEVGWGINPKHRHWLCVIADNSNPVGMVHLGLVWLWLISPKFVPTASEDAIGGIKFRDRSELSQLPLEPWSQMLLESGVV